ncbi:MAG: glycosyltransferase family 1 protein [Proteobacteria bacterium]|nr:MAG: glycosyltransferase family 1 protein [Pseudomonadota bacterium]
MQRLLILMDKLLCRFATNIYPEGEGVRNDLVNFKITKKPLKVIGNGNINGIDTSFYNDNHLTEAQKVQLRGDLSIEPDDFVFLFVGRLVRDKGIGELVSAFVEICETNKRIKLLLVGNYEDDLDPLPQETVRILESDPNIITTGFQAEIRQFYAISNVNVLPSYREGFPNVVMQAGAMGLPSIVTNISGSNEIIVDRENGLIVPSKDVQALKEAMQSVIDDRELLQHLTLNSRRAIVSRYDQQELWQAVLAEYKRLETARS